MVNKLKFVNRVFFHTLHRNPKSLSIITRNSIIKHLKTQRNKISHDEFDCIKM